MMAGAAKLAALAIGPHREGDLGSAFSVPALKPKPGEWSVRARAGAGFRQKRRYPSLQVRRQVRPDDRVIDHVRVAQVGCREPAFQPVGGVGCLDPDADSPGDFDRSYDPRHAFRLVGPHEGEESELTLWN